VSGDEEEVPGRPADEADSGGPAGAVLTAVSELRASLAGLESQAARDHDRAQAREAVIDRLHEEVERLRAGEARVLLRPAVTDLRRLRDDLLTQARSAPEAMSRDEVTTLLESYADSVVLILERCGIVAVRPATGTKFDPRQQQVSGIAETSQPDLDGMVASIMSDGYAEADGGLRVAPARVIVYRHAARASRDDGAGRRGGVTG
jgi:molecular chaperone GrpE (heat shock protein)